MFGITGPVCTAVKIQLTCVLSGKREMRERPNLAKKKIFLPRQLAHSEVTCLLAPKHPYEVENGSIITFW